MSRLREPRPQPPHHLRPVGGSAGWIRSLAPTGVLLLGVAAFLNFAAPSAVWFLLYPILIVGGLLALMMAAALLLRLF